MKKTYITPLLETARLEVSQMVCQSIIKVIDETVENTDQVWSPIFEGSIFEEDEEVY